MTQQQTIGLAIIAVILLAALVGCGWLLMQQERGRRRPEPQRLHQHTPPPGSFTETVLNAERAAHQYHRAVLSGNAEVLMAAHNRTCQTFEELFAALRKREEGALRGPYAAGPRSVIVTESDRLAGEPTKPPGDHP